MSPNPYLLDTTVLIDISRRRQPTTWWLAEMLRSPEQLCISAVTVAEFFAGMQPAERSGWQEFIDALTHWEVSKDIAIRAGILRYDLARQGRTLQIPDALIAATAVTFGAVLVTANIRDFSGTGVTTIRIS